MTGSLGSGWRRLLRAPDRILVPTLVLSIGGILVHVAFQYLIGRMIAGSSDCARPYLDQVLTATCGPTNGRAQLTLVIGLFGLYAVGQLVVFGLYRATLDAVADSPVRGPLRGWFSTQVGIAAVVAGLLLTINTIFLVLPAVILGFLVRYAPLFVLDAGLGPIRSLSASARFVGSNLGTELWFVIRALGVLFLGALFFGVGLFAAVPVVLLAQTERYLARAKEPPATSEVREY